MQYSLINAIIEVRWSDLDIQRKGHLTKTWISGKLSRNRVVFPPTIGLTELCGPIEGKTSLLFLPYRMLLRHSALPTKFSFSMPLIRKRPTG